MATNLFAEKIDSFTANAKAIAWDKCHKIYVLMDDEQVVLMRDYGYDTLITSDEMTPSEMSAKVMEWFDESCFLRFISAVRTDHDNPNDGFTTIIDQFEIDEDEEAFFTSVRAMRQNG